ncbi:hypothetical protein D7W79_34685 [Corallococcus exercitus]|uniref:hypothetical protein n=1 Tax=Corallococcus exercitus TaxID=2316736 RepID=UPI000EA19B86|nr:hypothetical protein [Corallococcus exercitus]RKG68025.1 hypothetical protein D7W79_34685 [Corallococcus exercitus]
MPLDLEAFQKTQVYQRRATVAEVLEDLRAMDPRARPVPEARQPEPTGPPKNTAARIGVGMLVAAVVALAILWFLPSGLEGLTSLMGFLFFGLLVGGILTLVASSMGSEFDSPLSASSWPEERFVAPYKEQRRLLVATVLQRFQVDLVQDAPVDVTLDLTLPLDDRKRVHRGKHGTGTREDFVDPWLSLQGRFADGTQLQLSVVEQVRLVHRTKVLPLKVKTKRKRSGVSLMTVALRVKPERHPGLAAMESRARDAVRLPPGARLKRVRVAEDRAELRVLLDEDWVVQAPRTPRPQGSSKPDASRTATMMLLSLYQVLNHSSSQARPGNVRSTS